MPRNVRFSILLLALWLLAGCEWPDVLTVGGPAQGMSYAVKVVDPPPGLDRCALRTAMHKELDVVDVATSTWRDDSDLARFNAAPAEEWVKVSSPLIELVG